MPSDTQLRLFEFVLWVSAVSGAIIGLSLLTGWIFGGDLITGKYILFVVGFLIFGLGSLLLQPSKPGSTRESLAANEADGSRGSQTHTGASGASEFGSARSITPSLGAIRQQIEADPSHQHRFEAKIQEIGPLADNQLSVDQRIGRKYKILVTSLVLLGFSFTMELLGIHV